MEEAPSCLARILADVGLKGVLPYGWVKGNRRRCRRSPSIDERFGRNVSLDELPKDLQPAMSVSYTEPGTHAAPRARKQTDIFSFIGPGTS